MRNNISKFLAISVLALSAAGCATVADFNQFLLQDSVKAVVGLIKQEKASDARYLRVKKKEYLAFQIETKSGLERYQEIESLEEKRKFIINTLNDAKKTGDQATELELKRVQADRLQELLSNQNLPEASGSDDVYGRILELYKNNASQKLQSEIQRVESFKKPKESDKYFKKLKSHIEPSIKKKGRTLRQILLLPLSPFVRAWMGWHVLSTKHTIDKVDFKEADMYRPDVPPAAQAGADVSAMTDAELLQYYAPIVSMEKKHNIKYDPKADQFGRIIMEGDTVEEAQPKVDVEHPVVYTYTEQKIIQGSPVKLLVYTLWFPERPQISGKFDPEIGSTQGAIIRVALNKSNQPLVYENVSSCGCYYKVFPSKILEQWASEEFQEPLKGKHFAIQNKVPKKIDADVPSLVEPLEHNSHAIAFFSAGTHEVIEIQPTKPEEFQVNEKGTYQLLPYETLESLPFHNGTISMFDKDGLVRNADRLESTLMAASGMFHAGTPRQRGTLMIYFDQADFDDPGLLEKYLRLPEKAFQRG